MKDKLDLLSISKKFLITKVEKTAYQEEHYQVDFVEYINMQATINLKGEIKYYLTGMYDAGYDKDEIDMQKLRELKQFCELMVKGNKNE